MTVSILKKKGIFPENKKYVSTVCYLNRTKALFTVLNVEVSYFSDRT